MGSTLSLQTAEVVAASEELRQLVRVAYEQRGTGVKLSAEAVKSSCANLPSQTTQEILKIRRQERAISSKTLAFSFA